MKIVGVTVVVLYFVTFIEATRQDSYFDRRFSDEELCARKRCGKVKPKGSMCTVEVDEFGRREAKCHCPTSCSRDNVTPVCSIYGREYNNKCFLHKEACRKRRHIRVAYEGNCIASQAKCEQEELRQFPFRLLAWFVHLKQDNDFGTIDPSATLEQMTEEKRQNVADWKFERLDRNNDDILSQRELKNFRYSLMPLEHCSKTFFKKCDMNKDNKIQKLEWDNCFVTGAWEWYEHRYEDDDNSLGIN